MSPIKSRHHITKQVFDEFLISNDTLRVYEGTRLIFASKKERLLALLEYIDRFASKHQGVSILDKVMGNAAALLSIKASCQEVYSPLGSQIAIATLDKYGIRYYFDCIVPYIQQPDGKEMCPMEKLSLDKDPEEFYALMKTKVKQ